MALGSLRKRTLCIFDQRVSIVAANIATAIVQYEYYTYYYAYLVGLLRTLESPLLLVRRSIENHERQQQQVYGGL